MANIHLESERTATSGGDISLLKAELKCAGTVEQLALLPPRVRLLNVHIDKVMRRRWAHQSRMEVGGEERSNIALLTCVVNFTLVSLPASVRRPTDVDLSVRIGSVSLKNPVLAASGTFGYGVEFAHLVDLNSLGGIVVKGLSIAPMAGAPPPRLCETTGGMMNAVGLQNIGAQAFVLEKLPELRKYDTAVIANVFGQTIAEYVEVARVLEHAEGLTAYELNISCPNTDHGGAEFGAEANVAAQVVSAVRKVSKRPLWVKLSPSTQIREIAHAVELEGADALTVANTYPAMSLNPLSGRSRLGRLSGGLSGPAIRPLTLKLVYDLCRSVRIPIIGAGGVQSFRDLMEYIAAGASAVEVGTAHFFDPRASEKIVADLRNLKVDLKSFIINNLNDVAADKIA